MLDRGAALDAIWKRPRKASGQVVDFLILNAWGEVLH
jgi:hypothetical protein